jgi:hypothetical protein
MRRLTAAALVLLATGAALPALAGEPERLTEATALADRIAELRKAQDRAALETELRRVAELHNALETAAARARLQAEVGDVLRDKDLGATRVTAADVLGALHDEKAWGQLRRSLPDADLEAALPLDLRVVRSAGLVAAPTAAGPLLDLARKAKDANLAREAVEALGNFGYAKGRAGVLADLLELAARLKPGGAGGSRGTKGSADGAERWAALQAPLLKSMNQLTGRTEASLEHWFALAKEKKGKLDDLFVRER